MTAILLRLRPIGKRHVLGLATSAPFSLLSKSQSLTSDNLIRDESTITSHMSVYFPAELVSCRSPLWLSLGCSCPRPGSFLTLISPKCNLLVAPPTATVCIVQLTGNVNHVLPSAGGFTALLCELNLDQYYCIRSTHTPLKGLKCDYVLFLKKQQQTLCLALARRRIVVFKAYSSPW